MDSVTSECLEKHGIVSGRSVSVVDTPGLFDTKMTQEEIMMEIAKSVYLSSPGPHAFLIVFPANMRFTEHEQQIPQVIEMMFGQEVLKYSIILFTHGDLLKKKTIEELINTNVKLRHLVQQCGNRFHVFNNEDENNREQNTDLLQKIDTMIEQNNGYYSNQMYEDAHRFRQLEKERRKREEEERKVQMEKQIQEKTERLMKEKEQRIREEMEAKQRSELERVKAERQREEEQRKQQEEKRIQAEIKRVRSELEHKVRAEMEEKMKVEYKSQTKCDPDIDEFNPELHLSASAANKNSHTGVGAIFGGAVGLFAGPVGAAAGADAGADLGAAIRKWFS
ncbi:GTPase IMAP family member 7-like [Garra rufa]|uniref:GTPase IMAP family member 7-like n=1 Tax=Garra rufa TaxID=137080 RepID=UPI003CCEC00C